MVAGTFATVVVVEVGPSSARHRHRQRSRVRASWEPWIRRGLVEIGTWDGSVG